MNHLFEVIGTTLIKVLTGLFAVGMAGAVIALLFTLVDIIRTFVQGTVQEH